LLCVGFYLSICCGSGGGIEGTGDLAGGGIEGTGTSETDVAGASDATASASVSHTLFAVDTQILTSGNIEISAEIDSINYSSSSFIAAGIQILTTTDTSFSNLITASTNLDISALQKDNFIQAIGISSGNTLIANSVDIISPSTNITLHANVQQANAPLVKMMGKDVNISSGNLLDSSGNSLTYNDFFTTLSSGNYMLKVRGLLK
jgi:hypothetical protein